MEKAKTTMKLADTWAKYQTMARLKDLVEEIYRLKRLGDIQSLLNTIPNRIWDPSSRINLLNIINKVARYREAARILYRTAQKVPPARRMKIVVVNLPRPSLSTISGGHANSKTGIFAHENQCTRQSERSESHL